MEPVRRLWIDELGLDVIARREGPDPELAILWGIPAGQFAEQLLLGTPGAATGHLHFVQFRDPVDAVRAGAAPTDLGAKNLDVNCTDMPERVARLQQTGYSFRSDIGEYELDGIRAREVQVPVHDDINLVLIEVLTKGFEVDYTAKAFAALTSFVVIVPDVEREAAFYRQLFGMENILTHKLSGPAIEMAAGLPAGTVLDLHLLGGPDNLFGRMELIEYVRVNGDDRFSHAHPPATGILHCGFRADSLQDFAASAQAHGVSIDGDSGVSESDLIYGKSRVLEMHSPAGLRIYVHQSI